jgi:hypothetical protein
MDPILDECRAGGSHVSNRLSDDQVMELLRGDSPLNRARREFSSASGRIEQAGQQRRALTAIEMRRMEFEAVQKILGAFHGWEEKG